MFYWQSFSDMGQTTGESPIGHYAADAGLPGGVTNILIKMSKLQF